MTPKVWGWLLWGSLALVMGLAVVANVATGGSYIYRDTFKYDDAGDGTAEEIQGAIVTAYALDSKTAYTSTTTDTALGTHNFALTLSDANSYYWVTVTNYSSSHYMEQTRFQVNTRNFTLAAGETMTVNGVMTGSPTFAGVTGDSIMTDEPRIAGLQGGAWKPSAGYQIPRGGMLSIRLDDYGTACYSLIDSLEAHNIRATLLAVTGLGNAAWSYSGVTGLYRSGYLRWRRDMAHGHEVGDHSTYHDATTGGIVNGQWDRGLAPSVYVAKLDSAKTSFASYLGQPSNLFVWPGGTNQMYFSDTTLTVYRGRFRFGGIANFYPMVPLSKWQYVGVPGTHNTSKSDYSHHPTNIPMRNVEQGTLAANRFNLAQAWVRHGWQTIFCHCATAWDREKLLTLALWADSLGIPILPMTEAAELYYYGDFDTHHNLFLPDPFSYDLDGNNVCDYFTDGALNDTSYTGAWTAVPDYTGTPCGTKTGALIINNGSGTHEWGFYVGGIRAGSYYAGSLWVKSHESVPDLPDTFTVALAQYDAKGNVKYTPVVETILSDSTWTQVAPASFTFMPPDTIADSGPPPLGGRPTEYLGFFVFNSAPYNSADKDSFLVACPRIYEVEEVGTQP